MTITEPDIHYPNRNIGIDLTFWQHHSIFAAPQEQLDELRADADRKAGRRYRDQLLQAIHTPRPTSVTDIHRPATRRLKAVLHVGLIPLLWAITTCHCGDRWPCNEIKQSVRHQHGWTGDITTHLKTITKQLPKPTSRWRLLWRKLRPGPAMPDYC